MKLENQVVSLELAKQLKELGVEQESLFYWVKGKMEYGYEGEWSIEEDDNYFILTECLDRKPIGSDFSIDCGDIGGTHEEWEKYRRREKRLRKIVLEGVYSAFTVAELGEMLPNTVFSTKVRGDEWLWRCENVNENGYISSSGANTEADARAKMLIHLLENKLITL